MSSLGLPSWRHVAILLGFVLGMAACRTEAPDGHAADSLAVARDASEGVFDERLADLDHAFDTLATYGERLPKAERSALAQRLARLREKRDALHHDFAEMERAGSASWNDLRADVERRRAELEAAVTRARLETTRSARAYEAIFREALTAADDSLAALGRLVLSVDPAVRGEHAARMTQLQEERRALEARLSSLGAERTAGSQDARNALAEDLERFEAALFEFRALLHREQTPT